MRRNVWKPGCCLGAMTDEEGSGVFLPPLFPTSECTPSYSSTIVHMARSPPTCTPLPSAGTRTCCCTFLTDCVQHVGEIGSGLERCRCCCELHRLHAVIRWATGLFYADFFSHFYKRDPQTSGTHLELFNERPSLP